MRAAANKKARAMPRFFERVDAAELQRFQGVRDRPFVWKVEVRGVITDMPFSPLLRIEHPQAAALRRPPPVRVKETWGGPAFPCEPRL